MLLTFLIFCFEKKSLAVLSDFQIWCKSTTCSRRTGFAQLTEPVTKLTFFLAGSQAIKGPLRMTPLHAQTYYIFKVVHLAIYLLNVSIQFLAQYALGLHESDAIPESSLAHFESSYSQLTPNTQCGCVGISFFSSLALKIP